MKNCILALIAINLFVGCSYAATFKVIVPGTSGDVEVSVNGQRIKLSNAAHPDIPYYVGDAPADGNAKYKV